MLVFTPKGLFGTTLEFRERERLVAAAKSSPLGARVTFEADGERCRIVRRPLWGGSYELRIEGRLAARARIRGSKGRLEACFRHALFVLQSRSALRRGYLVHAERARLGSVRAGDEPCSGALLHVPKELCLAERIFVAWLVQACWRSHAAAGGTVAIAC